MHQLEQAGGNLANSVRIKYIQKLHRSINDNDPAALNFGG